MATPATTQYGVSPGTTGGGPGGPGATLPFTGFDLVLPVMLGLAMLVAGVVLRLRALRPTK